MVFLVPITAIVAAAAYSITAMVFAHQRKMAEIYRGRPNDQRLEALEREVANMRARQNEHTIAIDSMAGRSLESPIAHVETGV